MNEKIGILTFHKSINYGSVLQSWALSRVISKRFVVEIIDYEPQNYEFLYANYRQWNSWNNIKYNLKRMPLSSALNNQQQLFKKFRDKQLPLSRKKYNYNNGCDIKEEYKGIVVGSDQVWNIRAKDCDGEFVFDITNDLDYARKFAGSKYVKSNPKNIYSKIHERLKQGDRVLFIGLPCQVAALNNYIKDKKNLYTVDLICHGSPSPIILEKYLAENYVDIKKIKDLNFRNKDGFGLRSGYKRISFDDGSDLYTFAFLTSLDYTENCYSCRYATLDRVSDITLGDSWGSELEAEEQKKGISLILCQTEKGKELLKNTKIELRDVNLNKAVEANHQLSYPSKMPTERKIFFKNIDKGFNYAISRCHPKMYYIRRLKYILHKAKIIRGGSRDKN